MFAALFTLTLLAVIGIAYSYINVYEIVSENSSLKNELYKKQINLAAKEIEIAALKIATNQLIRKVDEYEKRHCCNSSSNEK